jgi:hypothetical protein
VRKGAQSKTSSEGEFQVEHNGERSRLAPTGNAREAMSGSASQAKEAYAKFLDLWKGADTDLPALQQARAEAARFH